MSNNIEDEIVSMQFDNKQFESGVGTSLGTIGKLKSSLAFPDAGKGLSDINTQVGRFNMTPMSSAIQGVSKLWLGLATVAVTAISNITNKVVDSGLNLVKSFTFDPIKQGFQEYEKNLNSIQTIMANTGASVQTTNKYLNQLNHYSDQTIYSFGTMADSIGKFTAAGVNISDATSAIKGMANSAALGGSSVDQLNTAMYQVSQALATGTIRLMDWNSISTAGLGGTNMQKAFEDTARTAADGGAAMDAAVSSAGNFRDSLQAGWFSADIFNKTMKVFAGNTLKSGKTVAYTVKQLQGMGYSLEAAKNLNKLSQAAIDSATKVKTASQLIDVVKESIGSGWSKIFQDVFGNFKEASKLWTGVSATITGAVGRVFGAVDKMLVGWRNLGGFNELWNTVGNVFKVLGNLIHPVVALFQALLPSTGKAGSSLEKFTSFLEHFTHFLVKLTNPLGKTTFKLGFMSKIFKIIAGTVSAFLGALKPLLPILNTLGDYVGNLFGQGMDIAGNLIAGWTQGLDPKALQKAAVDLADSWVTWIKDALGIHSPAASMVPIGLNILQGIVLGLQKGATFLIGALQGIFTGMGKAMKYMVANISWSDILDTINTGLFLGLVLTFRQFVKAFTGTIGQFQSIMGKAGGVLDQVTSNLKTMQQKVKSEVIRNIAISVALLAASALLLSTIDTKKLGIALGAIGGLMIGLITAMKVSGGGKSAKQLSPQQIAKQSGALLAMGAAMIAFATAVTILTGAVAIMGQLDPKTIKNGLEGISGVIALIVAATAILGKTGGGATMLAAASAMVVLAAALTAFVGVMKIYEKLDMKTIVQGGGKAALVIAGIGLAMRAFGGNAIGGSVGLIIASAALLILAKALKQMAKIGGGDMLKTVAALVVILTALAAAGAVMSASEGGALSLLVMAAALIVLAKALDIIAKIPFWDLVKAIGAIVVSLALIAAAAVLLSPAIPLISALGIAVLLLGGGMALAGLGVLAFATALGIMAVIGPAAFQAIHDGIKQFLDLAPSLGEAVGIFLVSLITGFVNAAGPLAKAIGKLIGILIDEVIKLIPKLRKLVQKLINSIIDIVVNSETHAGKAVIGFVLAMLNALDDAMPKLIRKGTQLVVSIITGLGNAAGKIVNAMGKTILKFLDATDKAIIKYEPQIIAKGLKIAADLIAGMVQGIRDGAGAVGDAAEQLALDALDKVKHPWKLFSPSHVTREYGQYFGLGAALGIKDKHAAVEKEAGEMANKALAAMKMTFKNSKNAAAGLEDMRPKISPVLDLTQLAKDATQIGSHLGEHTISTNLSRRTARDIASEAASRHHHHDDKVAGDSYEFVQNNYSPKPINHVAAYRGTKSQIALFKEVKGQ
jgi:tape measure domain-containing protein